jgi:diacylglycerol O-acyltransferase-1
MRKVRLWAFAGMLAQVPMCYMTQQYKEHSWVGNVVFWFSFCVLGQPLMILL